MVIKCVVGKYIDLTEDMVLKIWEAQNDVAGAEVHIETLPAPHTDPVALTINGMDNVVHVLRLYTATSNELLGEWNEEATSDAAITIFDPIRFKIGDGGANTPGPNSNTYTDGLLAGLQAEDYEVFRNNYGILFPTIHYTNNSGPGGFTLIAPDMFNMGEEFVIKRKLQSSSPIHDSVVGKWFGGFVDIPANLSYNSGHLRRLLRFTGAAQYSFDGPVPIGYGFCFTNNTNSSTGTVKFNNAPLKKGSSNVASIDLTPGSEACFTFDGTNWNIVYYVFPAPAVTPATAPQLVLLSGKFNVGDVPPGDPTYTIQHNLNIVGDYMVVCSIMANKGATFANDNLIDYCWYHDFNDKPNRVHVSLQEIKGEAQDLSVSWIIIKL